MHRHELWASQIIAQLTKSVHETEGHAGIPLSAAWWRDQPNSRAQTSISKSFQLSPLNPSTEFGVGLHRVWTDNLNGSHSLINRFGLPFGPLPYGMLNGFEPADVSPRLNSFSRNLYEAPRGICDVLRIEFLIKLQSVSLTPLVGICPANTNPLWMPQYPTLFSEFVSQLT